MYELISGIVISGKKLGRTIGFPTANINLEKGIIKDGTYKIKVVIGDEVFSGVGVYLEKFGIFESHIFDFGSDIYGEKIIIRVIEKIRDNKKFDNFDDLKNQIQKDVEYAKNNISYVLTYGTYDVFHEGHKKFLTDAKTFADKLITVVSTNENVEKFKGSKPLHDEKIRIFDVASSQIPFETLLGNTKTPMDYILKYKPKAICLGYDQVGFSNMLDDFIKSNNLETKVFRLESYKPEIYKSSIIKKSLN